MHCKCIEFGQLLLHLLGGWMTFAHETFRYLQGGPPYVQTRSNKYKVQHFGAGDELDKFARDNNTES